MLNQGQPYSEFPQKQFIRIMKKEEFIKNMIELLEVEDASEITDATSFKDLEEWDSLTALSTISMVDDEYGITITNKDLKSVNTIGELFDFVVSKEK